MKRYLCLCVSLWILLLMAPMASATEQPWGTEYVHIIKQTSLTEDTKFILVDTDYNDTPELITGNSKTVSLYTYANNSVMKTAEIDNIPIEYFARLKTAKHTGTHVTYFMGQIENGERLSTYKIFFTGNKPQVQILGTENSDGSGTFQGDEDTSEIVHNSTQLIHSYLSEYILKPYNICILSAKEIKESKSAVSDFVARYALLKKLSDDTGDFSAEEREAIKSAVGEGQFASFDMISTLGNRHVFVQFYVNAASEKTPMLTMPYTKKYAIITQTGPSRFATEAIYDHEKEIDTAYIASFMSNETDAANVYISYDRAKDFRGFDDYVNYLSSVLSASGQHANENGKVAISEYIEYAVNRCSRTMLKTKNNIVSVNSGDVSFIADVAVASLARMHTLCETQNVILSRIARAIPELVCSGVDLAKPVRIEFESGLSAKLSGASGIRIMLDEHHGIYITAADLATLEHNFDMFCIEFHQRDGAFSVVFTDTSNARINYIAAPVWFLVPAKSAYATVMASFQGGTDNWGGQYDSKNKRIEFSTNYSGNYQIVENDITINDIDHLAADTKNAIRFMVSKGIFTLDKKQNFKPDAVLSRYDFTTALVRMFYSMNTDARTSFIDVPEGSAYYRYIASAEEQGIASGYKDNTFRGDNPTTKEQVMALCGRILVEKKGYRAPAQPETYLKFDDLDNISTWAIADIAVAVQCGLLENSGSFNPVGTVSREEGADVLYKTFMLLYDVSPITTVPSLNGTSSAEQIDTQAATFPASTDFEIRIALCIIFTIVFIFVCYLMIKIKKHQKKKQQNKVV